MGTDVAPSLVERVRTLTQRAFATKVLTSYRIVLPADDVDTRDHVAAREAMIENVMRRERGARSQIVMPAWEADSQVNPHVLDLYAYLSARADGKLGPGKPGLSGCGHKLDANPVTHFERRQWCHELALEGRCEDANAGTVIEASRPRVAPPRMRSTQRVWPWAPITIRSVFRSAARESIELLISTSVVSTRTSAETPCHINH